jgi:hypothetical protein
MAALDLRLGHHAATRIHLDTVDFVTSYRATPEGRELVVVGSKESGRLEILDLETHATHRSLYPPTREQPFTSSLAIYYVPPMQEARIVVGCMRSFLRMYDGGSHELLRDQKAHTRGGVLQLQVLPPPHPLPQGS